MGLEGVDGLAHRRLDKPYVRKGGKLVAATWDEAFAAIAAVKHGGAVAAVAGDLLDCETMYAGRELVKALGGTMLEGRQTGLAYDTSSLSAVNFNTGIANVETADVILLVGSDLRREAPLVNTRVQKAIRKRQAKVFAVGPEKDQTYKVEWLGDDASLVAKLPAGALDWQYNTADKVIAATMPGIGPSHHERAEQLPHIAMFGGMIHDEGGGTVRRGSAKTQAAASARLLDEAFISLRSATASRDWVGADASMRNTCTVSVMVWAWQWLDTVQSVARRRPYMHAL